MLLDDEEGGDGGLGSGYAGRRKGTTPFGGSHTSTVVQRDRGSLLLQGSTWWRVFWETEQRVRKARLRAMKEAEGREGEGRKHNLFLGKEGEEDDACYAALWKYGKEPIAWRSGWSTVLHGSPRYRIQILDVLSLPEEVEEENENEKEEDWHRWRKNDNVEVGKEKKRTLGAPLHDTVTRRCAKTSLCLHPIKSTPPSFTSPSFSSLHQMSTTVRDRRSTIKKREQKEEMQWGGCTARSPPPPPPPRPSYITVYHPKRIGKVPHESENEWTSPATHCSPPKQKEAKSPCREGDDDQWGEKRYPPLTVVSPVVVAAPLGATSSLSSSSFGVSGAPLSSWEVMDTTPVDRPTPGMAISIAVGEASEGEEKNEADKWPTTALGMHARTKEEEAEWSEKKNGDHEAEDHEREMKRGGGGGKGAPKGKRSRAMILAEIG